MADARESVLRRLGQYYASGSYTLIGLHGRAGSGKSYASRALLRALGHSPVSPVRGIEVPLSNPLKRAAQDIFRIPHETLWGSSKHRDSEPPSSAFLPRDVTPRLVLQELGDVCRSLYPDVFTVHALELVANQLERLDWSNEYDQTLLAIIPDVRRDNEAQLIREAGGKIWQLDVVQSVPDRVRDFFTLKHASETGINKRLIDRKFTRSLELGYTQRHIIEMTRALETELKLPHYTLLLKHE